MAELPIFIWAVRPILSPYSYFATSCHSYYGVDDPDTTWLVHDGRAPRSPQKARARKYAGVRSKVVAIEILGPAR